MMKKTSVLRASLTGFTGLVGAAAAAVVVAAVCILPLPGFTSAVTPLEVSPLPSEQTRVCSGPLLQVLSQMGGATTYFAAGSPSITVTDARGASISARPITQPDVAPSGSTIAPTVVSVPPAAASSPQPLLAATHLQQMESEELSGLAAATCAEASGDVWLVGGATNVGRTTLVLLTNPTQVTATVSLEILGENGLVKTPGVGAVIVEPGQQRVVSLAAYAPDVLSPVVHVTSVGGQVVASLQQSIMRALVPGGVETVTASAGPNTTQVITGVVLTGLAAQDQDETGLVSSDLEPTIRVAVPGAEASDVVITVIGASGARAEVHATVEPRHTLQLPFTGLVDGAYTVVVTGTNPVLAGVRSVQAVTTPSVTGGDFAWHSSALPLTGDTLIPVAAGPGPTLSLYNPTGSPITAQLSSAGAPELTIIVAAGTMMTAPLAAMSSTKYLLKSGAGLHAALTYSGPGIGASVAISPTDQRGETIQVYPR